MNGGLKQLILSVVGIAAIVGIYAIVAFGLGIDGKMATICMILCGCLSSTKFLEAVIKLLPYFRRNGK